ncbi:MAG: hypothetical protein ACQET8_02110 [Bacillota bacterium]
MKGIEILYNMGANEYESHSGYLIAEEYAVFKDNKWIMMVHVTKTECATVYRQSAGSMVIGEYTGTDLLPKIVELMVKFKNKTAFEFLCELTHNDEEINLSVI